MDRYVVIAAGGKGKRFGSIVPKQFALVNEKPLLMYTFDAFNLLKNNAKFILLLPDELIGEWNLLCKEYKFEFPHQIVEGGPTRFHSVKVGLQMVPDNVLVAIHDGARPVLPEEIIKNGFNIALQKGNAIPAIPINESIRETDGSVNKQVNRDRFRIVQTPQFFHSNKIKRAYLQSYNEKFTDDASVLEATHQTIHLFDGDQRILKVTTENDLVVVSALLGLF